MGHAGERKGERKDTIVGRKEEKRMGEEERRDERKDAIHGRKEVREERNK